MRYKYKVKDLSRKRYKKELMTIFKTCRECKKTMALNKFRISKGYYLSICRRCESVVSKKRGVKVCQQCGKTYNSKHKNSKFCSSECTSESIKNGVEKLCIICGKKFYVSKSRLDKSKCCSIECGHKYTGISLLGENHPNWKGGVSTLLKEYECDYCGNKILRTEIKYHANNNHFCSKICQGAWRSKSFSGENSHLWNFSLSKEDRIKGRKIIGYTEFINNTYKRDNYTCQYCGDNKGGNLVSHHLNGYNWDKENRTNVDNGVTLCQDCHKEFHTIYGYGYNTKEQYIEWTNNKIQKSNT
ncbi:HNH endonuclease [Clostridium sp.]|uniref:HNH endonuclease n=1 Tax=Clostridium sp. TaxID=1506 RepID=UPI0029158C3A|nr:HNH endonuclease [Clostridium sp.]MDU3409970.1 HNH endonuclease [Clostridium sp.]